MAGKRRRGAELEASILEAAWDELSEVGYAKLTMENVAARARTGKQVLYRRWHNRAELVVAAMRHRGGSIADAVPDTGDLRGDILAVLRHAAKRQLELGEDTIHGLLADVPDLGPEFFGAMRDVMTTVLRHADERGEVDLSALPPRVVTLPNDLFRYEMLTTKGPVPERTLVEIVDDVFLPLVRRKS